VILLSSCETTTSNINSLPLHRLATIEVSICKKTVYSDLVECLVQYKKACEQHNDDKNKFLEAIENETINAK